MRLLFAAATAVLLASQAVAQTPSAPPTPGPLLGDRRVEDRPALMVLGTAHLANNNRDVLTIQVDDVMTPARQAEIEAVVEALARWRPTHIAVEIRSRDQADLDRRYAEYRADRYVLTASEIDQIGLRLARRLNLDRVHAVDSNDMPPGVEADYNWAEGAEAAGEQARLATLRDPARGRRIADLVNSRPIPDWLAVMNSPEYLRDMHAPYHDFALLGTAEGGQGANWVGAWHGRNLKIFGNLVRLAQQPGDRVLVIYGAGHAFLLNRFGADSGAFTVESPVDVLKQASPAQPRP